MNLVVLAAEGQTEKGLYKKWIPYLSPTLVFKRTVADLTTNSFTIVSGKGYPGYLHIIENAFLDISDHGQVDYVFVCADSESDSYESKLNQLSTFVHEQCVRIQATISIIVQNHCIETWLMGNKRLNINRSSDSELRAYRDYYNVNILDPEGLTVPASDSRTIGQFSKDYLKSMLREKGLRYTPNSLGHVSGQAYFNQLKRRFREDNHIRSFGFLLEAAENLNSP